MGTETRAGDEIMDLKEMKMYPQSLFAASDSTLRKQLLLNNFLKQSMRGQESTVEDRLRAREALD